MERLWRTVKVEEVSLHDYETVAEATLGLSRCFAFYDFERLYQAFGYQTPAEVHSVAAGSPVDLPGHPPSRQRHTQRRIRLKTL